MRTITNLTVSLMLFAASLAQAAPIITLYPNVSPTAIFGHPDSPSISAYYSNTLAALRSGQSQGGGSQATNPAAFNTIGAPIVNGSGAVSVGVYDVFGTPEFNSWRGVINPGGAFSGELGTHYRTAVRITDTTAFTLDDIIVTVSYPEAFAGPFPPPPAPLSLVAGGRPERLAGIAPGGAFVAGSAITPTTLLTSVFFVGFGDLAWTEGDAPGEEGLALAGWRGFINSVGNFQFSTQYSLRGVSSSVTVTVADVPEPGTLIMLSVGLVGAAWLRRRAIT